MESTTLTKVFTRLRTSLLGRAATITGNSADAEDAVQDAFARLWTSRTPIDDADQAEGLSRTAVRNASIDILRRRKPTVDLDITLSPKSPRDLDFNLSSVDTKGDFFEDVQALIESRLSARDRDILIKRDMHGYEFDELAQLYGITEANVRMILSRARKTIRDIYRKKTKFTN